jgi:hypothetical protein
VAGNGSIRPILEFWPRSQFRRPLAASMEIALGGATGFATRDSLVGLAVTASGVDNAMRADAGFSPSLIFRVFQQYRSEAVLRGSQSDSGRRRRAGVGRHARELRRVQFAAGRAAIILRHPPAEAHNPSPRQPWVRRATTYIPREADGLRKHIAKYKEVRTDRQRVSTAASSNCQLGGFRCNSSFSALAGC